MSVPIAGLPRVGKGGDLDIASFEIGIGCKNTWWRELFVALVLAFPPADDLIIQLACAYRFAKLLKGEVGDVFLNQLCSLCPLERKRQLERTVLCSLNKLHLDPDAGSCRLPGGMLYNQRPFRFAS